MLSSSTARVEDLPEPAGPVTSTMPSLNLAISDKDCGGRPGEKIRSLIFSSARSMAPNSAGVAIRSLPEKPSSTTEIGAMVGAAIHPRLQNRTHHRLGSETLSSLYPVQDGERRNSKC